MNIAQERITPARARKYLASRPASQPPPDPERIERMAFDMEKGTWFDSPDALAFDEAGQLVNGLHRLWAVIKSGTVQTFLVVRGLSAKAALVVDQGQPRNKAQAVAAYRTRCGRAAR